MFTTSLVIFNRYFIHNQSMLYRKILIVLVPAFLWILSCERERFISDQSASLVFSVDTVYFDTVFTQLGTVTKRFTVHNPYKEHLGISSIKLSGGENSIFRLNVDGVPGYQHFTKDVYPKDSFYVFVEATLDPNESDDILLQEDSIIFITNASTQTVHLAAWGQDVHLLKNVEIQTQTWTSDKPYLIFGYAYIDTNAVLNVDPGVRIYFHRGAVLYVGGTIKVNGSHDERVFFRGDRLEKIYEDIPGQWGGIYLLAGSRDNEFNYADIRGGNFGIVVDTFMNDDVPALILANSFIADKSSFGLLARGSSVKAYNSIFVNCGTSAVALIYGGTYDFYHCTVANRWLYGTNRNTAAVFLNNYYIDINKNVQVRDLHRAYFGNCIIYGNREYEFEIDRYSGNGIFEYTLDHCLGKFSSPTVDLSNQEHFVNVINNVDPKFVSWNTYNFELDTLSPAKNKGSLPIAELYPADQNENSRITDGKPDIGAFERMDDDKK